jgi:hypothetical protein
MCYSANGSRDPDRRAGVSPRSFASLARQRLSIHWFAIGPLESTDKNARAMELSAWQGRNAQMNREALRRCQDRELWRKNLGRDAMKSRRSSKWFRLPNSAK